jgi:uncharacterized tellurite resistance protein B-like protein
MSNTISFFPENDKAAAVSAFRISDEAEACAAVLFACLRSSEIYGMTENEAFHSAIRSRNIFKGHDANALVSAAESSFEQAGSPAALIDAAMGAIKERTRMPLFYHCLDVILADGLVTPQEHKVFQYLKSKFRVNDETAWNAMEVLLEKNRL